MLNLLEELFITRVAAVNSFSRVLSPPPHGGKRIYFHPQTDFFVVSQLFSVARHGRYLEKKGFFKNITMTS